LKLPVEELLPSAPGFEEEEEEKELLSPSSGSLERAGRDRLPWLRGRWPQGCSNHRPALGWGRGRALEKLQPIPKAGRRGSPGTQPCLGSQFTVPAGGVGCVLAHSAGARRTDPDLARLPGPGALGAPCDRRLLRRLAGAALGTAAAAHAEICCSGLLEVAEPLCLAGAQPAHWGQGAARAVAVPSDGHRPDSCHPLPARVVVSVGYFLAYGADMLWNQTLGQAWDILCHHLVLRLGERDKTEGRRTQLGVVSCLSTTSLSGHYVGFSVMSLLLELNSACQHLWKLLLLSHQAPSLAFSMANCATHTLFCLVPLGWMSLWLKQIPTALVFFGGTGLVTLGAMIITVGICILVNNVLQSHPHPPVRGYKETRATRTCRDGEPVIKDDSTLSLKD
ncbi:hypothetical protein HPG69_015681, partial [Diceros bicornis minor]